MNHFWSLQDSVGGIDENQGPGTVKQRLFFVVRKELTDEEIIKKIGKIRFSQILSFYNLKSLFKNQTIYKYLE